MTNNTHTIHQTIQKIAFAVFAIVLGIGQVWAEGSKDLYPVDAKGGRGYLRASNTETPAYPYATLGAHYVYAEEGEQIALASNAQKGIARFIRLYAPSGKEVTPRLTSLMYDNGSIWNRKQELAGPRLPDQRYGEDRYMPIFYTVPKGASGVYRVEFIGTDNKVEGNTLNYKYAEATTWPADARSNFLIAWDISVAKQTNNTWNWVKGRVFTTSITLNNPSYNAVRLFYPNSGFYGVFKVLTKDGYLYNVDNNGSQGIGFTFMVNNQGFHKLGDPKTPSYESIPAITTEEIHSRYHDPRKADTDEVVTQKIFYNFPDQQLPEQASAAMDGGKTWLRVKEKQLNITDIKIEGAEGGENQGGKGAYITFTNEVGGEYEIAIQPTAGSVFPPRLVKGTCVMGENKIYWDGKDGAGQIVPAGHVDMQVKVKLHGGEVHFPYMDMELNEHGIIIELLASDWQSVRSDKVYWDDRSIGAGGGNFGSKSSPRNASHTAIPEGTSSRVNGHIWGLDTDKASDTFGDNQGIDTWTFIQGDAVSARFDVEIKIADLEVVSVVSDREKVRKGDEITYTVKVKNNGPHDVEKATFSFQLPQGFEARQTTWSANTSGSESAPLAFNPEKQQYSSQVNLANQGEITYVITLKATNPAVGPIVVEAAILRPNNVTDPDATNQEEQVLPTDPQYECTHNGLDIPCNNILENASASYSEAAFIVVKDGFFNDLNNDGFAQVGETITYLVKVTNTGKTDLSTVVVIDPLLGGVSTTTPDKGENTGDVLKANETWTYTLTYTLTAADLANKGVYNQATVRVVDGIFNETIEVLSVPTQPLMPGDIGYDSNRPDHTFVPLPINTKMITNPMVRQRMK